jgi:hypothetical protein
MLYLRAIQSPTPSTTNSVVALAATSCPGSDRKTLQIYHNKDNMPTDKLPRPPPRPPRPPHSPKKKKKGKKETHGLLSYEFPLARMHTVHPPHPRRPCHQSWRKSPSFRPSPFTRTYLNPGQLFPPLTRNLHTVPQHLPALPPGRFLIGVIAASIDGHHRPTLHPDDSWSRHPRLAQHLRPRNTLRNCVRSSPPPHEGWKELSLSPRPRGRDRKKSTSMILARQMTGLIA